jgi:hypothetical protein
MSRHVVFAIGGIIVGLVLLAWLPWYVTALIIVLDPSQRRRLRENRRRGIGG